MLAVKLTSRSHRQDYSRDGISLHPKHKKPSCLLVIRLPAEIGDAQIESGQSVWGRKIVRHFGDAHVATLDSLSVDLMVLRN